MCAEENVVLLWLTPAARPQESARDLILLCSANSLTWSWWFWQTRGRWASDERLWVQEKKRRWNVNMDRFYDKIREMFLRLITHLWDFLLPSMLWGRASGGSAHSITMLANTIILMACDGPALRYLPVVVFAKITRNSQWTLLFRSPTSLADWKKVKQGLWQLCQSMQILFDPQCVEWESGIISYQCEYSSLSVHQQNAVN